MHGLMGGPYRTWRISEEKTSATDATGLVEKLDDNAGKEGTCWPEEWLADDLPFSRLLTVKYKVTNPLQTLLSLFSKSYNAFRCSYLQLL